MGRVVSSTLVAVLVIAGVAVLALLMRRGAGVESVASPATSEGDGEPAEAPEADEADAEDDDRRILVTSEGVALAPSGHTIRLVPLLGQEEAPDWLRNGIETGFLAYSRMNRIYGFGEKMDRGAATGTVLSSGDFTGARVRRNAEGQWCLETLGRDGDFGFMPFGAEDRAREALAMLEDAGILQRPLDENGDRVPPSDEDFEEARRRYEATEAELALSGDEDEPPPPAEWSSRR